MTGIFTAASTPGKPRCARCHRPFTPKGDEIWGPTCARKMHAQLTDLSALDHLDPTDGNGEPVDEDIINLDDIPDIEEVDIV